MKKSSREIFSCAEENTFSEYKVFPAEQYVVKEIGDSPREIMKNEEYFGCDYNEESSNKSNISSKKKKLSLRELTSNLASSTSSIITSTVVIVGAIGAGVIPEIDIINKKLEVITESLEDISTPNRIQVKGKAENINSDYIYYADVYQYQDNDQVCVNEQVEIEISDDLESFSFEVEAYYGVSDYQYEIYCEGDEEDILYISDLVPFEENQSYDATYNKVKPNESKITFNLADNTYNVEINTGFKTNYPEAFSYRLNILDIDGNIYATYQGQDSIINLTIPFIDKIFFEYTDVGDFAVIDHEYEKVLVNEYSLLNIPIISISDQYQLKDDKFVISYELDSLYDISNMSLSLQLETSNKTVQKEIDSLSKEGIIVLNEFEGEIGELKIEGQLRFQDSRLDAYEHSISLEPMIRNLNYVFDISRITAFALDNGEDFIPVHLSFNKIIPDTYSWQLIKQDEVVSEEKMPVSDEYSFNSIGSADGGSFSIKVFDENDNLWKEMPSIVIHPHSEVISYYRSTNTSYSAVNPYESVVTYNDDSTINIYRMMNFTSTSENAYYDASLYTGINNDDGSYQELTSYLSRENYSIVENLPFKSYFFIYYGVFYYEDVYYYLESTIPSGGITFDYSFEANYEYDPISNKSTITLVGTKYGMYKNECMINETTYQFDNYEGGLTDRQTVTIDGDAAGMKLTFYYNFYANNYDEYSAIMPLKGNKYKAYEILINGGSTL